MTQAEINGKLIEMPAQTCDFSRGSIQRFKKHRSALKSEEIYSRYYENHFHLSC